MPRHVSIYVGQPDGGTKKSKIGSLGIQGVDKQILRAGSFSIQGLKPTFPEAGDDSESPLICKIPSCLCVLVVKSWSNWRAPGEIGENIRVAAGLDDHHLFTLTGGLCAVGASLNADDHARF